jgi:hypothetical protein
MKTGLEHLTDAELRNTRRLLTWSINTAYATPLVALALLLYGIVSSHASGAPSKVIGCMSLMSPDVLFCTDSRNRAVMCETGDKPLCRTMTALYRSWRGHPERREAFYRKLYGVAQ